jgi:putative phosphoribosyl transferase
VGWWNASRVADRTLQREVAVAAGPVEVRGILTIPEEASAVVLFAHGTGSGRLSPRNRQVAESLHHAGLATLLFDLLTEEEERADLETGHLRFDIGLLSERLSEATRWLEETPQTAGLRVGYFGASTGAAAALVAAAERPGPTGAVVSRGGRPDLAGDALDRAEAPTLLIVGSLDPVVLDLNREALERLPGEKDLQVVEGASHLFEEPGALDRVADLARDWFVRYLGRAVGRD